MAEQPDSSRDKEEQGELMDPLATLLFLAFTASLGYLLIASSFGLYPWIIVLDQISFIPTWDAVITFLGIVIIMFLTLIGGLVKMRYSMICVGVVTLFFVFMITFFIMLFVASFTAPIPP